MSSPRSLSELVGEVRESRLGAEAAAASRDLARSLYLATAREWIAIAIQDLPPKTWLSGVGEIACLSEWTIAYDRARQAVAAVRDELASLAKRHDQARRCADEAREKALADRAELSAELETARAEGLGGRTVAVTVVPQAVLAAETVQYPAPEGRSRAALLEVA